MTCSDFSTSSLKPQGSSGVEKEPLMDDVERGVRSWTYYLDTEYASWG
jgi:hypothetical protein